MHTKTLAAVLIGIAITTSIVASALHTHLPAKQIGVGKDGCNRLPQQTIASKKYTESFSKEYLFIPLFKY